MKFSPLPFALAVLLPAAAFGGSPDPYGGGEWALLDRKGIVAAAAAIDRRSQPDCDQVTIDGKDLIVVHPDGTAETQVERYVKVLTQKGRQARAIFQTDYYVPYTRVEVPILEIISPNGEARTVDIAANQSEASFAGLMRSNIYDPDYRIVRVNIPGLEVGDTLHSVFRVTLFRPIVPGEYADEALFEGEDYIRHLLHEVRLPASLPLKAIVLRHPVGDTLRASSAEAGATRIYRWEANRVPRMYAEPRMPPPLESLQHLVIGTSGDWGLYSRWYWKLSLPHLEAVTPEMKAKVAALTAGAATDLDRIKALFYYVSKEVRYMGVTLEKDRPGFEPHDVSLTFERKYGVCRDKAALLVSLLRAAGFKAYPVLISVGTKKDPEVPNPFFNHAIVGLESTPGNYTLMDPTDENTRELLPSYDTDQSYLVCRPEGETLRTSPVFPFEKNLLRISTTASIGSGGGLLARSVLHFDGVNDDIVRGIFARMKPDDRRRFFARLLQLGVSGAKITALRIAPENMLDLSRPLTVELGFAAPARAVLGRDKSIVTLPWIGKGIGIANYLVQNTALDRRKYPLKTYFTCGVREELSLTLAGNFTRALSIPASVPIDDEAMGYRRQLSYAGHTLTGTREFDLKRTELSPEQYLQLKEMMKDVAYDDRKALVMASVRPVADPAARPAVPIRPAPVESDSRMLLAESSLVVKDAHSGVVRTHYLRKILTYAGKKRQAEFKIPYNPALEEVRLIRAVAISPDGRRQEVTKDELNVMDQGWNTAAKRYTGGKILVANLPGVEIGSTLDIEYEMTRRNLPFLSGFVDFQLEDGLDAKSLRITAPPGIEVHRRVFAPGAVAARSSATGAGTLYEWKSEHMTAIANEDHLPPPWIYKPAVDYFVGDPAAYYRELNRIMSDRAGKGTKAEALARSLAAPAKGPGDAVRAIRDYVASRIRRAGPPFTLLPLDELSDADTTLEDGYGHDADRAILLSAMLRGAGLKPEFVLASNLAAVPGISEVAESEPLPYSFREPLVRVEIEGRAIYLNDTDQYAHLGTTPHDGMLGIDLGRGGPLTIEAAKDCRDGYDTAYTVSLGDDGRALVHVRRLDYGLMYERFRRQYAEAKPEERRRQLERLANQLTQGARPVGPLLTDFIHYPGREEFTVAIDRCAVVDGNYFYVSLLPFGTPVFQPRADERTLPIFLGRLNWSRSRTEIELPPSFRQIDIAPADEKLSEPHGAGWTRINTGRGDGKFVIAYDNDYVRAIIPPADYPAILAVENALKNPSGKVLLLERTAAAPTAKL